MLLARDEIERGRTFPGCGSMRPGMSQLQPLTSKTQQPTLR